MPTVDAPNGAEKRGRASGSHRWGGKICGASGPRLLQNPQVVRRNGRPRSAIGASRADADRRSGWGIRTTEPTRLVALLVLLVFCPLVALTAGEGLHRAAVMPFPGTLPPRPDEGAFSFIAYGDVQGNNRGWHEGLVRQMEQEDVDLIIHTGDVSPDAGENYDRHFLPAIEALGARVPFFPSPGNHDVDFGSPTSREGFRTFFGRAYEWLARLPANVHLRDPDNGKLWYALVHGGVLFVGLDSNLFIDEGKYASTHALPPYRGLAAEQVRWLQQTFERYDEDASIRARIVYLHHSPFVTEIAQRPLFLRLFLPFLRIGGHPGHDRMMVEYSVPGPQPDKVTYLLDLFRLHGVTAVFSGHEHFYERWREIIEANGEAVRRIAWIVTGQGGARPRGRPLADPAAIAKRIAEMPAYGRYLDRAVDLGTGWSARLEHAFPNPDSPDGLFPHYVLVTVGDGMARFETKDITGRIRDEGAL